ncbi:MAG: extracellular solute-binding protein [Chloroflexi bacterium]|nr:MAG: extracellular solute-binding protein [Chloroflexota bacterium]
MRYRRLLFLAVLLMITAVIAAACSSQPVEVTRVITETVEVPAEPVEVTRIVEVEAEAQPKFPEGTEVKILQWSHFVPQYDVWFDPFAEEWGRANGVNVTVDHVNIADLAPSLSAAIDAGEGPTLVELPLAAANFVEGVHDLSDVVMRAQELYGPMAETCVANSYLPAIDKWYGYCHGWVPDPGDYDIRLWTEAGFPEGPDTWDDLLEGGAFIKENFGVPMGLGLSPEIDSNMAMRAIIWSFGGSIQDENECVTINSPEVVSAVEYLVELYNRTMTEEVFSWNAASNNQGLIAGELSYILNSISAYRSLQKIDPEAADNIGFVDALKGPNGEQHASAHLWYIYVIPNYVEGPELEAAKEFLLHLTANYNQAVFNSELYNFPAFESTVPQLEGWLANDPFGSRPPDKLQILLTAKDWVTYLGWPGPSNPAVAEVYATNIIPTMMGKAALGELTPEEAVAEAEAQINEIFAKWREKGLVGCNE